MYYFFTREFVLFLEKCIIKRLGTTVDPKSPVDLTNP
jgi:hypothetical protein